MMEQLQLREEEIVYYFDTFDAYDTDHSGKIRVDGVEALFNQSGLPIGTLNKIIDLCGAQRFGYLGRSQFFIALKLISLAQSGYDVSLDALKVHGRNLPLPVFDPDVRSLSKASKLGSTLMQKLDDSSEGNLNTTDLSDTAFATLSEMSAELPTTGFEIGDGPRFSESKDAYPWMRKPYSSSPGPVQNNSIPASWIRFNDEEQLEPEEDEERVVHNYGLLTNERVDRPEEFSFYGVPDSHHTAPYKDPFTISPKKAQRTSPRIFGSSPSHSPSIKTTPSPTVRSHRSSPGTPPFRHLDSGNHSPGHEWAYHPLDNGFSSGTCSPMPNPALSHPGNNGAMGVYIPVDHEARHRRVERAKSTEDTPSPPIASSSDGFRDLSASEPGSPRTVDRRWLSLFTLHPKEEAQYADQFDQVLDARRNGRRRLAVTQTESRAVFLNQFNVTPSAFEKIWRLADMDRDNRLSKPEFCLAAHLAHLHGRQGLSIEQAVSATASYIADHLPWDLRHSIKTAPRDRHSHRAADPSNPYQPMPCSPPSDVPNNPVCVHPTSDPQVYDHAIINNQTCSSTLSVHTSNPPPNCLFSNHRDSASLVDDYTGRDSMFTLAKTVREHGEEASDEELGLEDGEAEPETALLPQLVLGKHQLHLARPHTSGSSPSRSDSDSDARVSRPSLARSAVEVPSSSSSVTSSSSSDEEHVLSSNSTTVSTTTAGSTSSSSSSSAGSDSENETSDRKGSKFDPNYLLTNGKLSSRKGTRHRRVDPIQLLAITTGRRPSKLAQYSAGRRCRLLGALIREAKSVNHTLLRLNNEMQGEWNELNDQRVNLSAQLRHLGLHPPS